MCVVRDPEEGCVTLQKDSGLSSVASVWTSPLQEHADSQAAARECATVTINTSCSREV